MHAIGKMRAFAGALLLGPSLVMADGSAPVVHTAPAAPILEPAVLPQAGMPSIQQAGMPAMPMWPQQMMPAPGMVPFYGGMPPGMMLPMPAPYPVPMVPGKGVAEGTEPAAAQVQPALVQESSVWPQGMMPSMPMWPQQMMSPMQMMPGMGAQPFYGGVPPGMMWQMPSPYPAAMMMPSNPQIIWVPFMRVLVPAQAEAPTVSGGIDHGPVAPAPVVPLPLVETAIKPVSPAESAPAAPPAVIERPAPAGGTSAVEPALPVVMPPAVSAEPATPPDNVPVKLMAADYGPIAPTPVVYLSEQEEERPATPLRKKARSVQKSMPRSATLPAAKTSPKVTAEPVKQRMCWSQGVVAPCR